MPLLVAHRHGNARSDKSPAEGAAFLLRRPLPRQPLHRVVGNEIDLGVELPRDADKRARLRQIRIDALDEDILQRDHVLARSRPRPQSGNQLAKRPLAVDGHDARAHGVARAVQGNSEAQRLAEGGKAAQARHVARSGNGDVARADAQRARIHDESERGQQIVHVGERLAHAHEDEIVHPRAGHLLRRENLAENLRRRQIAREAQQPAGAKLAAESAAHLGRNAEGDAVAMRAAPAFRRRNDDRLHQTPVLHAREEFARSSRRAGVDLHHLQRAQSVATGELLAQGGRQVGHGGEIAHAPLPDPLHDLAGSVGLLPQFLHKARERLLPEFEDALRHGRQSSVSTYSSTRKGRMSSFPSPVPR